MVDNVKVVIAISVLPTTVTAVGNLSAQEIFEVKLKIFMMLSSSS